MEYLKLFLLLYVIFNFIKFIRAIKQSRLFHALSLTDCKIDSLYEIGTRELGDLTKCIVIRRCNCCGKITWSNRDTMKDRFAKVWNGTYLTGTDNAQYDFYLKRKQQMREEPQFYNGYADDGEPDLTELQYNAKRHACA